MMIRAYSEDYLDDAMKNLGEAVEYAPLACHVDPDSFLERFLVSRLAEEFERGNPRYVCGMSGTELARLTLIRTGDADCFEKPLSNEYLPAEYWCGWSLAHYQWYSCRSFRMIRRCVSMQQILQAYPALHQSPDEKFLEYMDDAVIRTERGSRLQQMRRLHAYSQRILADKAGVNLRTLQQYETGAKDIRKASFDTVQALAWALDCSAEDIVGAAQD